MSRLPSRSAHRAAPIVASSPAVAGFRPAGAALAIAAAFGMQPVPVPAQPTGAQAIHGSATLVTSGGNLTVKTANGAGTSHSAINWQSFSVPKDTVTHFAQPTTASTSINRVVGPNPSASQRNISEIFGTLSSNGRLVLVNPEGIAIGKGGMVDTAGFTASTLRMSQQDAIAGRLLFNGGAAALQVDGSIRSVGGDVVLIAPKVQTGAEALVRSDGAVVLAAGQKVEITGRGLEGIHLQVQAGNEAVNLGQLQGDAVGMFAGTLRHSGRVLVQAASSDGGKVVLKAIGGDNLVSGSVTAAAGARGGSIAVLGQRVGLLAGAALDASGDNGGGQVRVGGDYQGKNAQVPNAARTYVDAHSSIRADAKLLGDGGRVIVWADDATRMHGQISARGGAQGGNGGFAEVSGRQYLEFSGRADLRAPAGATGLLLLDPEDITIVHSALPSSDPADPTTNTFPSETAQGAEFAPGSSAPVTLSDARLNNQLAFSNVQVTTSAAASSGSGGQITLNPDAVVRWANANHLALRADKGIALNGSIINDPAPSAAAAAGALHLLALDGGIVGSGAIQVPFLVATALSATGGPNAGKVRLSGSSNKVNVLAGNAGGSGGEFSFVNSQALTIGTVESTVYPGGSGISAANVNVSTTAGALSVAQNGRIMAGAIALQGKTDVRVDGNLSAGSGLLKIRADNDILVGTIPGALTQLFGQVLELQAGHDIAVGTNTPPPTTSPAVSRVFLDSNQGTALVAGRDVRFRANTSTGGSGADHRVRANAGSGTGVRIEATTGAVELGNSTYVFSGGGGIDVLAGSSLLAGNTAFDARLTGTVQLSANAGSLSYGSVTTSSSNGSFSGLAGGLVRLRASASPDGTTAGDISGGDINAGGTYGSGTGGRNGGKVDILATGGNVTVGSIATTGGNGNGTVVTSPAGNAGTVDIAATAQAVSSASIGGNITVGGALNASGGDGFYGGGAGANVTLTAMQGAITVGGDLSAGGGSATHSGLAGNGGAGGIVAVNADRNIQLANVFASGGNANRGSSEQAAATGGAGGQIRIASRNGNLALGQLGADQLSVAALGAATAAGGAGLSLADGGAGGSVTLSAAGPGGMVLATGAIDAHGGAANEGLSGDGGALSVEANSRIRLAAVDASAATNAYASAGKAGSVKVTSANGAILLTGDATATGYGAGLLELRTSGEGAGITVQGMDASARPSTLFAAGGGTIRLEASQGSVIANWALQANADSSATATAGTGGTITIAGRDGVQVQDLYARGVAAGRDGGGTGGSVKLGSSLGDISTGWIDVNGQSGGSIEVTADAGTLQVSNAFASAIHGPHNGSRGGGTGGTILLSALGQGAERGSVRVDGGLEASGGDSIEFPTEGGVQNLAAASGATGIDGGRTGRITVQADKQVWTDYVTALGGTASPGSGSGGTGGTGGTVLLSSARDRVEVRRGVFVVGGNGRSGGRGGDVTVTTSGDILVGDVEVADGLILAGGGAAETGVGGKGGTVTLTAASGSIRFIAPPPPPSSAPAFRGITATGGQGPTGGEGGALQVQAAVDVDAATLEARGGEGLSSAGGGAGGKGGTIAVTTVGGTLAPSVLDASGGSGQGGQAGNLGGGAGGAGGSVSLTKTTLDLLLSGLQAYANGGLGGWAASESSGTGGTGGAGGSIVATAQAGKLGLAGAVLSASGAAGGGNGDDTTNAAAGGPGSVTLHAAGAIDTNGADLAFGRASFTARAGGNIDIFSTISTRGGEVTLSAGDIGAPARIANAVLNVAASIDTTDGGQVPGAPVTLMASGRVSLDVPPPATENASAAAATTAGAVSGSTVNITAPDVNIAGTVTVVGTGGVQVTADALTLDGFIASAPSSATIQALSAARAIHLGGRDETGSLNLTQAELDHVTAARLVVGSLGATGGLSVDTPITVDPGRIPDLGLVNGGAVVQTAGAILTAGKVGIKGGSVVLDRVIASGPVVAVSDSSLRLNQGLSSDAAGDAVALSATSLNVGTGGAITTPNGRWLIYLSGPLAGNSFGALASHNNALWNRTFPGSPPATVSESGNRYLFAFQPTVAVSANSFGRVYDGSVIRHAGYSVIGLVDAAAYGNVFLQDVVNGDVVLLNPGKNVGSYAVTQGTIAPPPGYAFSFNSGTGSITPRTLKVGVSAQNKVYDATTAATAGVTSDDRVAGDALAFGLDASFADKNAGKGKTVNLGYSLTGADAGNYVLAAPGSTSADIVPRNLAVAVNARGKVYDGTTSAAADVADNHLAGDSVAVGVHASFVDKNAGPAKTVNLGGYTVSGTDAGNYVLAAAPTTSTAAIAQRQLRLQAQAQNKVYDGTTAATASFTDDRLAADALTVGVDANFADRNAGAAKTVTLRVALSGADAGNYALAALPATTADISRRSLALNVSARDKVYDATTAATADVSDNRVAGDALTVGLSASFTDKNVGNGKSVNLGGYALSGADAVNYVLASAPASSSANITPAPLSIAADNLAKAQGTELTFKGTEFSATGLQGGEAVASVALTSEGAPAAAPTGAYAIVPGSVGGGNGFQAGNYDITLLNGVLAVGSPAAVQQVTNQVVAFANLFVQEAAAQLQLEKKRNQVGRDDIVVTDTACKPS